MAKRGNESERRRIDWFLPEYDFTERHHLDIAGSQADVYNTARHLDFSGSAVTRRLFAIRRLHAATFTIEEITSGDSFAVIDETPPQEFVIGLVGTGTRSTPIEDGEHFRALAPSSGLKIAWNFHAEVLGPMQTRLHTETRVACIGRTSKAVFTAYWIIVRPFSGLIRKEMLKAARTQHAADSAPTEQ